MIELPRCPSTLVLVESILTKCHCSFARLQQTDILASHVSENLVFLYLRGGGGDILKSLMGECIPRGSSLQGLDTADASTTINSQVLALHSPALPGKGSQERSKGEPTIHSLKSSLSFTCCRYVQYRSHRPHVVGATMLKAQADSISITTESSTGQQCFGPTVSL